MNDFKQANPYRAAPTAARPQAGVPRQRATKGKRVRDYRHVAFYLRPESVKQLDKMVQAANMSRNAYMQALIDRHISSKKGLKLV